MAKKDYYEVLGVDKNASEAEIKLVFIDACRNMLDNTEGIAENGGNNPGVKGIGDVKGAGGATKFCG